MKQVAGAVAQKLLNLYRQEHVIIGGWAAVNKVFLAEATDEVLAELRTMPTGEMLARHIENLRTGRTPADGIERQLMPYGGLMSKANDTMPLTSDDWYELETLINNFTPDTAGLETLRHSPLVRKFGEEWMETIHAALNTRPEMKAQWDVVTKTYMAYHLWDSATEIITQPLSERTRAQVQADMPAYETYLPMFGADGAELLGRLRNFISNIKSSDAVAEPTPSSDATPAA